MMNEPDFDKIDAYLSETLTEAEMRAFEAEIAESPELAAAVNDHQLARQAIDRLMEIDLRSQIGSWRQTLDDIPAPPDTQPQTKIPPSWRRWFLLALLLICSAGAIWLIQTENIVPNSEMKSPEQPPFQSQPIQNQPPVEPAPGSPPMAQRGGTRPNTPIDSERLIALASQRLSSFNSALLNQYDQTMGNEEENDRFFSDGLNAWRKNDTLTAVLKLMQVESSSGYYGASQELLAQLFFRQKAYDEAALAYEHFAAQNHSPTTEWRLLQFYLATYSKQKPKFWKLLNKIAADNTKPHPKRSDAQILRLELKKLDLNE